MAGAGFLRRFTYDPGNEELLAIEGVVIIDREPPAQITGVGTGMVTLVGEFEDGAFNTPYEISSPTDLVTNFGGFGFTYGATASNNPCARTRRPDLTLIPEYWNGNGFVALMSKRFRQLNVVRVDTSVGNVDFRRVASLIGNPDFTYGLATANTFVFHAGAGAATATFTGAVATHTGGASAFPWAPAGGEQMTYVIDGVTYTTVFEPSDTSNTLTIARLNATAGYTAFAVTGAPAVSITGRQGGTGGNVQIVSLTASVAVATGFAAGASIPGTGNVANIGAVTLAECSAIIVAAAGAAAPPFVVTVTRDENSKLSVNYTGLPLTGVLTVTSCSATALGFTAGQVATAVTGVAGVIPAGTLVSNAALVEWVTTRSIAVTAASAGPYRVSIRPALDTISSASSLANTVTTLVNPIPGLGMFTVTNALPIVAALTDAQIDAAYVTAIGTTANLSSIVRQTNIIVSARQSNAIRTALRSNAVDASAQGCYGRMAVIRPPLKTTRTLAKSTSAQPGVGAYRHQRVVYAYPGVQISVPQIAAKGVAGGAGFTANGIIDVGSEIWVASVMSNLPPEENPGQDQDYMLNVLGLEAGNTDVQNMTMTDYRAFKASGIAAIRMEGGKAIIQSGITSVDPLVSPSLKNINRQRMADFIQDTLSLRLNAFVKKLARKATRADIMGEINAYMTTLSGEADPANQRIDGFLLDGLSGNTPETLAAGLFRIILKVRTLPSMDTIVLDSTVGESVVVTTLAV